MSTMEQLMSEYFAKQASGQVTQEDLEKQAQAELFSKLAAANGIDLEKLSEAQIAHLWNETFSEKTASEVEEEKKEKAEKEKESESDVEEKAKEEHEKKKEAAAKLAEADYLGRFMAHTMVAELKKLAAAPEGETEKEAAMPEALRRGLDAVGRGGRRAVSAVSNHMERTGKGITNAVSGGAAGNMHKGMAKAIGAAAHVGGAAAVGAAGYGAKKLHDKSKEKKSSALDQLAAEQAVIKAAEAGFDPEQAGELISAVLTLGLSETEKVAMVQDFAAAVDVRSLEFLEAAGYPVTWNQG